jgi:hypothetical protein
MFLAVSLSAALALSGCVSVSAVTGLTPETANALQSETDATRTTANGINRVVVTYNDESGNEGLIIQSPTSRHVNRGASLLGWSYSENTGRTWTYGGKVRPPAGWAVLWGDPATTTSGADAAVAFISNLAVPDEKFPEGGIDGPFLGYIGGACIARSTDGGRTFVNYQCVSNKEPVPSDPGAVTGHFYDGGSMASTPAGEVYAAYIDLSDLSRVIRVWRAANHNAPFELLEDPFPGLSSATHPRLRATGDGSLLVASQILMDDGDAIVFANRYRDGRWAGAVQVSDPTVVRPTVDLGLEVLGSPLIIRTGPQFSFDVGAASAGGNDAVRFLYTRASSGRLFVEGSACAADLTNCHRVPGWRAGPSAPGDTPMDRFDPAVAFGSSIFGLGARWTSSFYTRSGASTTTVALTRMYLNYVNGIPIGTPVDQVRDITVCSDQRGYWGDYDDMLQVTSTFFTPVFVRFTSTDQNKGCIERWAFTAKFQHVQAVRGR